MIFVKRILVAEDEDVIRDFVVINLRRNGYEVVDVPNGDEAIRVFDENNGDFDICLLDIMMPGKDGFTVCKEIRKRSSTVGIIMLSAKSQEMDKVGALMFGADDYVTKPFGPAELIGPASMHCTAASTWFLQNQLKTQTRFVPVRLF